MRASTRTDERGGPRSLACSLSRVVLLLGGGRGGGSVLTLSLAAYGCLSRPVKSRYFLLFSVSHARQEKASSEVDRRASRSASVSVYVAISLSLCCLPLSSDPWVSIPLSLSTSIRLSILREYGVVLSLSPVLGREGIHQRPLCKRRGCKWIRSVCAPLLHAFSC